MSDFTLININQLPVNDADLSRKVIFGIGDNLFTTTVAQLLSLVSINGSIRVFDYATPLDDSTFNTFLSDINITVANGEMLFLRVVLNDVQQLYYAPVVPGIYNPLSSALASSQLVLFGGGGNLNLQQVTTNGNTTNLPIGTPKIVTSVMGDDEKNFALDENFIQFTGANSGILASRETVEGQTQFLATEEWVNANAGSVAIVVSANTTAQNDKLYHVIANATFTDPSPVAGKGYTVFVRNGTATIGSVAYSAGRLILRVFHSGAWSTYVFQDSTIIQSLLDAKQNRLTTFNRQTSDYTLVAADNIRKIEMNVSTANTLTIPLDSSVNFEVGTRIPIIQRGAGITSIAPTSGVTLQSANSWRRIAARYGNAEIEKVGANEWYLYGNLMP